MHFNVSKLIEIISSDYWICALMTSLCYQCCKVDEVQRANQITKRMEKTRIYSTNCSHECILYVFSHKSSNYKHGQKLRWPEVHSVYCASASACATWRFFCLPLRIQAFACGKHTLHKWNFSMPFYLQSINNLTIT